jgi:hypothetical protein
MTLLLFIRSFPAKAVVFHQAGPPKEAILEWGRRLRKHEADGKNKSRESEAAVEVLEHAH